ncbi:hypothetical protein M0813_00775 [Anaeramoeba flamelloides]|uniref:Uncharacterized protein n=1 Tax=Anaeramoeba flamelloides TaxID=1746091 RepID=A0ABQ8XPV1_9EUKA|nr:hypothetical protein M0813_00775 [Anaeramoeba flamelloides]
MPKIIYFVLEMDSSVPKTTQQSTFLKSMAGNSKAPKKKKNQTKGWGTIDEAKAMTTFVEIAFNSGENGMQMETRS